MNNQLLLPETIYNNCNDCDGQYRPNELVNDPTTTGQREICQSCYDSNYSTCYFCDGYQENGDLQTTQEGDKFCENCRDNNNVEYCDRCEEYTSDTGNMYHLQDQEVFWCSDCFDSHGLSCNDCGNNISYDASCYCEDCDTNRCSSCSDDHDHEDEGFDERSAHTDHVYGEVKGEYLKVNRLIGVEIEAEDGHKSQLDGIPASCGISSDGSLDSTGVEIQTPPRSLNKAEDVIKKACSGLIDAEYRGTSSCGLHVHIDVTEEKNDHKKLIQLFQTVYAIEDVLFAMLPNSRQNNSYCDWLANRYKFNEFAKCNKEQFFSRWYKTFDKDEINRNSNNKYHTTRYSGLNMHSAIFRGTIEFRHHSGTVNSTKILQWASLLLHIVDYSFSDSWNLAAVENLNNMDMGEQKVMAVCKILKVSMQQKEYIKERIAKFNPERIKKSAKRKITIKPEKYYTEEQIQAWFTMERQDEIRRQQMRMTYDGIQQQTTTGYGWYSITNVAGTEEL